MVAPRRSLPRAAWVSRHPRVSSPRPPIRGGRANGPCGGTKDNVCEFGDRECIHNQIYRVSKQAGLLANLEEVLMPPVPEAAWGSCSWVTHFRGEGPKVTRLPAPGTRGKPSDASQSL